MEGDSDHINQAQLQELLDEIGQTQETCQTYKAANDDSFSEAIRSVQAHRQETVSNLQLFEKELEAEANKFHSANKKRLEGASVDLENIKRKLQSLSMQQRENRDFDWFVSVKQAQKEMTLVASDVDRIQRNVKLDKIKFERNMLVLDWDGRLGKLTVSTVGAGIRKTRAVKLIGVSDPAEQRTRSSSPKNIQEYTPSNDPEFKPSSKVDTAKGTYQRVGQAPAMVSHHKTSSRLTYKEQDFTVNLYERYPGTKTSSSPLRVGEPCQFRGRPRESDSFSRISSATSFQTPLRKEAKVGPMKVTIVEETIEEQKVDCVLVPTNESLDLGRSGSFKALLQAGGITLQDECKSRFGRLEVGQVVMIEVRNLRCISICLTVLPPPGVHLKQELKNIVIQFLGLAQAKRYCSVALPALDTDCPQYPRDVVCRSMHEAVVSWEAEKKNNKHREGQLCHAQQRLGYDTGVTVGPMKVKLVVETIEEQNVDCVLVTTNESLDLRRSGSFKALLQAGGVTLQDECKTRFGRLEVGQVVMIKVRNLRCVSICLTVLPPPGANLGEELKLIIIQFLALAQDRRYLSVAIPALDTDCPLYPRDVVCRSMHEAVVSWAKDYKTTCIEKVNFVMHNKDLDTTQVFQKYFEMLNEEEERREGRFTPYDAMPKQGPDIQPVKSVTVGPMKVELVVGAIVEQKVDCLLITTHESLDLRKGRGCKALLQAGGITLQDECKSKYGRLEVGQELKKVIHKFLRLVQAKNYSSVAMAALGTGALKYPRENVCRGMHQALEIWAIENQYTCIRIVRFVVHSTDWETIKVFQRFFDQLSGVDEKTRSGFNPFQVMQYQRPKFQKPLDFGKVGPTQIQLVVNSIEEQNTGVSRRHFGDIAKLISHLSENDVKVKVDCVLVTTNESLDLGKGGACKDLYQVGGFALQEECKSKFGRLEVGQVVIIDGGNLRCKSVCLTVLSPLGENSEEELKNVIKTFLGLTQAKKYSSVAMPALGTGFMKYPRDIVCRGIHNALLNWSLENINTCIRNVRLVVHSTDRETIRVFQKYFDRLKKQEETRARSCSDFDRGFPVYK